MLIGRIRILAKKESTNISCHAFFIRSVITYYNDIATASPERMVCKGNCSKIARHVRVVQDYNYIHKYP